MDILVRKENEIVVASGSIIEQPLRNMYFINNKTHIQFINRYDLFNDVTLPDGFKVKKYKYNPTDGFYLNEDYQEPIELEDYVRQNRDRIKTLEDQMAIAITTMQNLKIRVLALENRKK